MGKVFRFDKDVDTDQIIASQYLIVLQRSGRGASLWRMKISAVVPPGSRLPVC